MNKRILKKRMRGLKPRQRDRDLLRNKIKEWKRLGRDTSMLEFYFARKNGKTYRRGYDYMTMTIIANLESISNAYKKLKKVSVNALRIFGEVTAPTIKRFNDVIREASERLNDEEIHLQLLPARDKAERYQDEL